MSDREGVPHAEAPPHPVAKVRHRRFAAAAVWLLPVAALGLAAYLGFRYVVEQGPSITIRFETAAGLSEQQTEVRYKSVTLGTVEEVELSEDLSEVVAHVRMNARAEGLLTENTRFWVVRPRLGGGLSAVSTGLETLVSGAYVAMDPGDGKGRPRRHFEGLTDPPSVRSAEPGTVYFLEADSLDGLHVGAPVLHRDVEVGEVLGYELRPGASVKIRIFVKSPYDARVVGRTRFWNASGISVRSGAHGLEIRLESVRALLSGAVAFHSPPKQERQAQSPAEAAFKLHPNEAVAEVGFFEGGTPYVTYFETSVQGLAAGSEVSLLGKRVGAVTKVELAPDPRPGHQERMAARVGFVIQPERELADSPTSLEPAAMRRLVGDQLKVVLTTKNLLTDEKVLSLEYVEGADAEALSLEGEALVLPSEVRGMEEVSRGFQRVTARIEQIPFEEIGANLNGALASVNRGLDGPELRQSVVSMEAALGDLETLARQANADLGPAMARLPDITEQLERASRQANRALSRSGYGSDSTVHRNLTRTLSEVGDAARSVRLLADYLNQHPEALLTGRAEEAP